MLHAHKNMWSLPSRDSHAIAIGIGKPIRNAGGRISTKQTTRRKA